MLGMYFLCYYYYYYYQRLYVYIVFATTTTKNKRHNWYSLLFHLVFSPTENSGRYSQSCDRVMLARLNISNN